MMTNRRRAAEVLVAGAVYGLGCGAIFFFDTCEMEARLMTCDHPTFDGQRPWLGAVVLLALLASWLFREPPPKRSRPPTSEEEEILEEVRKAAPGAGKDGGK